VEGRDNSRSGRDVTLGIQAAYYLVTGIWPFAHLRSFLAVTGPKRDIWLLKTVSSLVVASGLAMASAVLRGRVTPEIRLLGAGSAISLAGVDLWYVLRRRISPVYLADALIELAVLTPVLRSRYAAPGSSAAWSSPSQAAESGSRPHARGPREAPSAPRPS
jgi:hypothetical protein